MSLAFNKFPRNSIESTKLNFYVSRYYPWQTQNHHVVSSFHEAVYDRINA